MQVTQITEAAKSRSKIFLDGAFAFVLYKGELRRYHIKEGGELAQADYDEIMTQLLPKRAKLRAMNLLTKREYTTSQLREKLRQGFYPENVIEEALEYVASFHYTDDLRYALDYINTHESTRSRLRICQDLQRKGISRETLDDAFAKWAEQGGEQDEQAMIQEILNKKHFDPVAADDRERQRIFAFLLRRGFQAETVRRAIFSEIS